MKLNVSNVKTATKIVKRSVLAKVIFSFVVFTIILNLAQNAFVAKSRNQILSHFFEGAIAEKMSIVEHLRSMQMQQLKEYAENLPLVYPEIPVALSEENYEPLNKILADGVSLHRYYGYVLVDEHFDLLGTSFEGYTQSQLITTQDLMRYVARENVAHLYAGYAEVMGKGVGLVMVRQLRNSANEAVATLLLCQAILEDDAYLTDLAKLTQSQMSFYRRNVITATSYDGHDVDIHGLVIPNAWVADSIAANGKQVTLTEVAGDNPIFSSYTPVFNHRNKLIGISHTWMDLAVVKNIQKSVIAVTLAVTIMLDVILIFLVYIFLRRNLSRPLTQLTVNASQMSSGDLTHDVVVRKTGDEVEYLGEAMKRLQDSLRESVHLMKQTAATLQRMGGEMTHTSANLAASSSRQATNLEEITASLEEMTNIIHVSTDNTNETDKRMTATDAFVRSIAERATETMLNSRKIADSIKSINALVSQTNILSLNASVEAARAGQAGLGFSAVAREVGRISDVTKKASMSVSDTATKTIEGVENINGLIDEILPQLHDVASRISEIKNVSNEQRSGIDMVSTALSNLSTVTQETATDADEIASRADELAFMADRMEALVSRFKI